jgi:type I restriction enzyme S subunit
MNAQRLLAHYEKIADAPDAVPQLRRLVLDLAVRGKLVPQDPNDEPAANILRRIAVEKAQVLKKRKAKWREQLQEPDPDQAPFNLPAGWSWARFPELGTFGRGKSKHRPRNDPVLFEGGTHLMIQTGDVARSKGLIDTYTNKYNDFGLSQSFKWPKGTLCITIAANIADSGILNFDACFPDSVIGFIPASIFGNARYFEYFVRTAKANLLEFAPATAQKNINLEILSQVLIALPPLAEQHRIVAKVDELMALCDRLEVARAEREATRDRFTAASLARLNAPDPDTFRDDARFALDALPALTARADQIRHLRQTILNLAVRGRLVPQDPKDGTGDELLRRLAELRNQARVRREASNGEIKDEEKYLEIPASWTWARVHQVGMTQTGTSPSSSNPALFGDYVPFVKPADLDGAVINYDGPGLSEEGMHHSRVAPANTLLMVCIGATLGKVNVADRTICFNQQINAVTPYADGIHRFVALALKATGFQDLAWSKAGTGTLPIISKGKWEVLPIPLPPLSEQQRIVSKVDGLMSLCDRLEASLATTAETRRRLLGALLAEALVPQAERELEAAE